MRVKLLTDLGGQAMHQLSKHSVRATTACHAHLQRPLTDVRNGQGASSHLRHRRVAVLGMYGVL